ncbi:cupredoxin domain-containing protein [Nguyenibacter sp. L1]|uniref:cupredoxin domain-containing protein n=1 Tax=Nguyenibacter sp. L1 TaxID=3049350 RepID=UPI0038CF3558
MPYWPISRRGARILSSALAACCVLTAPLPGQASGAVPARTEIQVKIADTGFIPATLTIGTGATVTWTNTGDTAHELVATVQGVPEPEIFRSPPLDIGDRFSFRFVAPGRYRYFCAYHPEMTGTVTVR